MTSMGLRAVVATALLWAGAAPLAAQETVGTPPPAVAAPSATPVSACEYDRTAMLALDLGAFDQDMDGGWRQLANKGCYLAAADLIRDWRETHAATIIFLPWHEGQMRAIAGQTEAATALFDQARQPAEQDAAFGWNFYVDGSIAFLRGDRAGLEAARASLAALPRPEDYNPLGLDGKPVEVNWPMNLNVLDGFLRCWGQSYKDAYSCPRPLSD